MKASRPAWRHDLGRLWAGLAVSQLGTAISGVALPIVAVTVLHATTLQVAALAVIPPITTALIAFPAGTFVEFRRKRPMMIAADLTRLLTLGSVPVAAMLHLLTLGQLCLVAMIGSVANIVFSSASQANLVDLVGRDHVVEANGRLQSTNWLTLSIGPAIGGGLVSALSAAGAVAADALSFIASAVAVWRIRTPEPAPPAPTDTASRFHQATEGLRFAWGDRRLRRLLLSWVVYAGSAGLTGPLNTIFMLRERHFSALDYGLIMAIGSVGGFIGSRLTKPAVDTFGIGHTMYWGSILRAPWFLLIPLAGTGIAGVAVCALSTAGTLVLSAAANSAMGSLRQILTPDALMSRVATLWSFATTIGQPAFILLGGQLAASWGTRPILFAIPVIIMISAFLLPCDLTDRRTPPMEPSAESVGRYRGATHG